MSPCFSICRNTQAQIPQQRRTVSISEVIRSVRQTLAFALQELVSVFLAAVEPRAFAGSHAEPTDAVSPIRLRYRASPETTAPDFSCPAESAQNPWGSARRVPVRGCRARFPAGWDGMGWAPRLPVPERLEAGTCRPPGGEGAGDERRADAAPPPLPGLRSRRRHSRPVPAIPGLSRPCTGRGSAHPHLPTRAAASGALPLAEDPCRPLRGATGAPTRRRPTATGPGRTAAASRPGAPGSTGPSAAPRRGCRPRAGRTASAPGTRLRTAAPPRPERLCTRRRSTSARPAASRGTSRYGTKRRGTRGGRKEGGRELLLLLLGEARSPLGEAHRGLVPGHHPPLIGFSGKSQA